MALLLILVGAFSAASATSLYSLNTPEESVMVTQAEYELLEKYKRLEEIYMIVDRLFLWEYDEDELLEGAAQGMLGALGDDYTFYYTPDEMVKENETLTGEYGGLGIEVFGNANDDTITIKRVFYDSPAQRSGLRATDKIIGVNGEGMRAGDMNTAVSIMRGEVGGEVTLTILRDKEVFEVTLERALIQTEIIAYRMLEEDIAYLRVFYFEGNLMGQFAEAQAQFIENGAKGLILDLRENPGGLVTLAIDLIDAFVGEVPILHTEDKFGRRLSYYGRADEWDIPIVIIQDGYSASAAEIVSVALQENGRATVVGMQSYGKGIMQSVYPFQTDGAGMQITSDYWLSPEGNNLHKVGVTPDIEVERNEDAVDENYQFVDEKDDQLQAAITAMRDIIEK